MPDNYDKLWLQNSLNQVAITRVQEAIQNLGYALPCSVVLVSGSVVTVKFEIDTGAGALPQITIPKAESQWIRNPTQIGDTGITVPADAYLGGISGLGGGTATLKKRGNLSTLCFLPVASTGFAASPDVNKAWVNGPNGAILSNKALTSSVTISNTAVTILVGGKTWTFTSAGLTLSNGDVVEPHVHGGVSIGGSNTGPMIG